MKRWIIWASLALASACGGGGPSVTLNFTFQMDTDCDDDGIDSIQYYLQTPAEVEEDAGVGNSSVTNGNVQCGQSVSFNVPVGMYQVTAYAISDGDTVNTVTAPITVTASGNNTFDVDFSSNSM